VEGTPPWLRADIEADRDKDGAVIQWRIVLMDITEPKRLETDLARKCDALELRLRKCTSRLEELEKRLRLILDTLEDAFWVRNAENGRLIFVSPAFEKIWDRPLKQLLEDPDSFLDSIHPEDRDLVQTAREKTFQGLAAAVEYRILLSDGSVRWIRARGYPVRDDNGRIVMTVGTAREVTASKQAEIEMKRLNENLRAEIEQRRRIEEELKTHRKEILQENTRRKSLSIRLVDLLERDRREIASALHDDLGMILTSTSMELESLKDGLDDEGPMLERIRGAQARVKEAMEYVRNVSRRLRPDVLDHLGLAAALANLVDSMKTDGGPRLHLFIKGVPKRLGADKQLTVYRIVQEALTNTLKHAKATNVFVNLVKTDSTILLTIEDDGIGFQIGPELQMFADRRSLGIVIMEERARQVKGTFQLETRIGKGTHVLVEIPLD